MMNESGLRIGRVGATSRLLTPSLRRGRREARMSVKRAGRSGRRSVYADRFKPKQRVTPIIMVFEGNRVVTGVEVDGEFVSSADLPPCCESPIKCHRPECWTLIAGEPDRDELW